MPQLIHTQMPLLLSLQELDLPVQYSTVNFIKAPLSLLQADQVMLETQLMEQGLEMKLNCGPMEKKILVGKRVSTFSYKK